MPDVAIEIAGPEGREPDCDVLFIRADGFLAGFAVVNRRSYSGEPCDFSMAEFFVARKFRRAGVGKIAALTVIGARVGQWEIDVVSRNRPAQSFWRSVAAPVAGAQVTELSRLDEGGNGLILRFRVSIGSTSSWIDV